MGRVRFGFNGVNLTGSSVYDMAFDDLSTRLEATAGQWWHDPRRLYLVGPEGSDDVVGSDGSTHLDDRGPFRLQMTDREVRVNFIFGVERSSNRRTDQALANKHIEAILHWLKAQGLIPVVPAPYSSSPRMDFDDLAPPQPPTLEWPAHPRFAAHFRSLLYADAAGNLSPLGNDDAASALDAWIDRVESGQHPTALELIHNEIDAAEVQQFLRLDELNDEELLDGVVDTSFVALAGTFFLLRWFGECTQEDKDLGLLALRALERFHGEYVPQIEIMRRDLLAFRHSPPTE